MSTTHLKIKIKSLAAEAVIIRREEEKIIRRDRNGRRDNPLRLGLREHRLLVVRREARAALLAYGFLRGRPLKRIEAAGSQIPFALRGRAFVIARRFNPNPLQIPPGELERLWTAWAEEDGPGLPRPASRQPVAERTEHAA